MKKGKPANFYISKRNRNPRKRNFFISLAVAFLVALVGYNAAHKPAPIQPPPQEVKPEVKAKRVEEGSIAHPRIVLLSTLSGPSAKDGEMLRRGADLAWEELTSQGVQGELVVVDGVKETSELISSVSQLAADPQVLLIISHLPMATLSEIIPICEKNQLPLVVPAESHEEMGSHSWVFPLFCTDMTEGAFAATVALKWAEDKVPAVIYEPGPYGNLLMEGFREQAGKCNLKYYETASASDDPFLEALISGVIAMDAPVVWLAGPPSWGIRIANVLNEKGYKGRLLVTQCYEEKFLDDLKEKYQERLYVLRPVLIQDSTEGAIQTFTQSFHDHYWREPNWLSISGFDVMHWIGKALETPPLSRKKMREYFVGHNSPEHAYHGLGGPVFFDESVNTRHPIKMGAHRQ